MIGASCFAFPKPFEFDRQSFDWQFFFWLAVPLNFVFNIVYDLILRHPIYDVARTALRDTIVLVVGGFVLARSFALFWRVVIILAIVVPAAITFDLFYPDRGPRHNR